MAEFKRTHYMEKYSALEFVDSQLIPIPLRDVIPPLAKPKVKKRCIKPMATHGIVSPSRWVSPVLCVLLCFEVADFACCFCCRFFDRYARIRRWSKQRMWNCLQSPRSYGNEDANAGVGRNLSESWHCLCGSEEWVIVTDPLIDWLIDLVPCWLDWASGRLIDWLICSTPFRLYDRSTDWLIDWCSGYCPVDSVVRYFYLFRRQRKIRYFMIHNGRSVVRQLDFFQDWR